MGAPERRTNDLYSARLGEDGLAAGATTSSLKEAGAPVIGPTLAAPSLKPRPGAPVAGGRARERLNAASALGAVSNGRDGQGAAL